MARLEFGIRGLLLLEQGKRLPQDGKSFHYGVTKVM
jgi:hypothetical protein